MKHRACGGTLSTRETSGFVGELNVVKQNAQRYSKHKGRWQGKGCEFTYAEQDEYETDGHLLTNLSPSTFCTFTLQTWLTKDPTNFSS